VPTSQEQSPIRFYRLKNTKAVDVLATIAGLQTEEGLENFRTDEQGTDNMQGQPRPRGTGMERSTNPQAPRSDRPLPNPAILGRSRAGQRRISRANRQ